MRESWFHSEKFVERRICCSLYTLVVWPLITAMVRLELHLVLLDDFPSRSLLSKGYACVFPAFLLGQPPKFRQKAADNTCVTFVVSAFYATVPLCITSTLCILFCKYESKIVLENSTWGLTPYHTIVSALLPSPFDVYQWTALAPLSKYTYLTFMWLWYSD